MGKGSGRGRGACDCVDSMVYVWSIILIAVTTIFLLTGLLGQTGDIIPSEAKYGPWYAWFIAVVILLVVFVVLYLISMQYAETVLATKFRRVDDDVEMAPASKSMDKKPGL